MTVVMWPSRIEGFIGIKMKRENSYIIKKRRDKFHKKVLAVGMNL